MDDIRERGAQPMCHGRLKFIGSCFGLFCLLTVVTACEDRHGVADIRDASAGTYSYHIIQYVLDDALLIEQADGDDFGTFELTKTENGIALRESGIQIIAGENCKPGPDGYSFDIPEQQLGYDGELLIISGFEGNISNDEKVHGVYNQNTEQITAFFSARMRFQTSRRVFKLVGTKAE